MKKRYRFAQLSKDERDLLELLLMEEIEVQVWFTVTYSCILREEVFMNIQ